MTGSSAVGAPREWSEARAAHSLGRDGGAGRPTGSASVQVHYREYHLQPRSRAGAVALGVGVVVVGGALVVVGATLLLALGAVGVTAAAGTVAWRRLTGRGREKTPPVVPPAGLDPRLEVFPPDERRLPPAGR